MKKEEADDVADAAAEEEEGHGQGPASNGNPSKGKGKNRAPAPKRKKKAKDIGKQGTHQLERIEGERRGWSREKLIETYGQGLRISVGDETAWAAITGSSMRVSSLIGSATSSPIHQRADRF